MKLKVIYALLILVIVLIGVYWLAGERPTVTTFEECARHYPVLESYPEQCNTPDGQHFVRATGDDLSDLIHVATPLANAQVVSPLTITGEARGPWFFEASFPVTLLDANGTELAIAPATAQGEWMTTEFVPFSLTLSFATPTTETGTLVLHKDNPSDLRELDRELRIPVRFSVGIESAYSFGQPTALVVGDSKKFTDGLRVKLLSIDDSRCRPDVTCIWQGELSANLEVSGGDSGGRPQSLRLGTVRENKIVAAGYTFQLLSATETTIVLGVTK